MGHHEEDDRELKEAQRHAGQKMKRAEMGGKFTLPEGRTVLRLLRTPADKERSSPFGFMEFQEHRDIGPNKRLARCGNAPGQSGHCWICKKRAKAEKEGRTAEAKKLAPQLKLAVQVAVFDKELEELVGPFLWTVSQGSGTENIGYKLWSIINDDHKAYMNHKSGYNFSIKRRGQRLKTRYGEIEAEDEKTSVPKGIIKQLKPFVDCNMYPYDEQWQKDAFYGREDTDKEKGNMAKKKQEEESSSSEAESSSSEAESSSSEAESSSSEAESSSSEAESSSSEAESSSSEADKKKKKKKGKGKKAKDSSESEAESSSSEAESSSSEAESSSSEAESESEAESSSSEAESSSSEAEPKKKKGRGPAKKGKAKGKAKRKPKK